MSVGNLPQLLEVREKLEENWASVVDPLVMENFQGEKDDFFRSFKSDFTGLDKNKRKRKKVSKILEQIAKEPNMETSKFMAADITAKLISRYQTEGLLYTASIAFNAFLPELLILYIDAAYGSAMVGQSVNAGLQYIRGQVPANLWSAINNHVSNPADQVEWYYRDSQFAKTASELLERDSSGRETVVDAAKWVKKEPSQFDPLPFDYYDNSTHAASGADLALEVYQSVLPVAQELVGDRELEGWLF